MPRNSKKKGKKRKVGGKKKRPAAQRADQTESAGIKGLKAGGKNGARAKGTSVRKEPAEQTPPEEKRKEDGHARVIELMEKIDLEKSPHTYRSFLQRRYGKYFIRVRKPVRFFLTASLLLAVLVFGSLAALFMVFGRDLPDVSRLKTMNFYETTRIYDREGNLLYSIFSEENRKYVPLNFIDPMAVNATLSIEDKNFYQHLGFDLVGMVRAQVKNIQEESIQQGASTITQQLAKNIFLSPERTYERKIKELLLALQIEWMYSKDEILEMYLNKIPYGSNAYGIEAAAGTFFGKTSRELDLAESAVLASLPKAPSYFSPYGQNRKELMGYCSDGDDVPRTMEMVDEEDMMPASQEGASPQDGTPPNDLPTPQGNDPAVAVQSASSLKIKAKNTVWVQTTADGGKTQFTLKPQEEKNIAFSDEVKLYLGNTGVEVFINGKKADKISAQRLLTFRAGDYPAGDSADTDRSATADPAISADAADLADPAAASDPANADAQNAEPGAPVCTSIRDPNYVWGRKDYVLERMLEDRYITESQMEEAWKKGLTLKFRDPVHKIEAPHFVFYVKELLEQKYGKELVEHGGLEVKTSLDPKMQSIAEEAVVAHAADNLKRYRANNAALVAIDPRTGQILSMVGSIDYWNGEIDGQVNVAASPRQPGSSFKPLVYALAMMKAGLGSGTVLGDYKTVFNKKDVPHNSDNTYRGSMTIRTALSNSRNIPAIKAYYLAGEEEEMLNFLDKVGLQSLRRFRDDFNKDSATRGWTFFYGWPMAIGSGEVRLVDLAGAYGALANGGNFLPVNPLLEVRDRKGVVLEKFNPSSGSQVIDPQVAYVINNILADVFAKPAGSWRNSMTIEGHTVASKTGTSNKKVGRAIYPNNNIMIGYTPEIVAAVWVGNTDGGRMVGNAWAFADAGPIWKQFMTAILKDKPDVPFPEPPGLKWVGKEVYPAFADLKTNFDKRFKKVETQETGELTQFADSGIATDSSWLAGSAAAPTPAPAPEKPINGEPASSGETVIPPGPGW